MKKTLRPHEHYVKFAVQKLNIMMSIQSSAIGIQTVIFEYTSYSHAPAYRLNL